MKEVKGFDDFLLVPQYSDIESRSEINTQVKVGDLLLGTPIIASPMSTVTEAYMINALTNLNTLGIIHRYNTVSFQKKLLSFIQDNDFKSAAIGVTGDYKERLEELVSEGLRFVCIDIAHGDHILMKNAIEYVKSKYPELFVIAGNISTSSGYERLSSWGADAIRLSVGSGSICTTRIQTGHGIPTMQAIINAYTSKKRLMDENKHAALIVADGGIKNSGDIVKCLAVGADLVMLGSMLSGTKESPGKVIIMPDGTKSKRYNGMASKAAQRNWKGSYSSVEGVSSVVPYKGTVAKVIREIMSNVRSGMSYSGARNLEELRNKAQFVLQSSASTIESGPHIYKSGGRS
tara:strand:+ start:7946 stop:8986 length:1041 start_codon:yes stop_codon:yes gene_type:complete